MLLRASLLFDAWASGLAWRKRSKSSDAVKADLDVLLGTLLGSRLGFTWIHARAIRCLFFLAFPDLDRKKTHIEGFSYKSKPSFSKLSRTEVVTGTLLVGGHCY